MKQQTLSMAQKRVGDLQQLVRELENRLEDTAMERETLIATREEEVTTLQAQVCACTAKSAVNYEVRFSLPLEIMKLAMP